jgi:hypothetical protein
MSRGHVEAQLGKLVCAAFCAPFSQDPLPSTTIPPGVLLSLVFDVLMWEPLLLSATEAEETRENQSEGMGQLLPKTKRKGKKTWA